MERAVRYHNPNTMTTTITATNVAKQSSSQHAPLSVMASRRFPICALCLNVREISGRQQDAPETGDWLLRFVPHRQLANKSPKHAPKPVTASYDLYPTGSSPTISSSTNGPKHAADAHSIRASISASVSCMSSAPLMQSISRLLLFLALSSSSSS